MTPKTITTSTILQAISEESMGFRFGKPERPNELSLACILPILRETSQERQRKRKTFWFPIAGPSTK